MALDSLEAVAYQTLGQFSNSVLGLAQFAAQNALAQTVKPAIVMPVTAPPPPPTPAPPPAPAAAPPPVSAPVSSFTWTRALMVTGGIVVVVVVVVVAVKVLK